MREKRLVGRHFYLAVMLGCLSLLVVACAGPGGRPSILADGVHHVLRDPPPERFQAFAPADRVGVMVRDHLKGGYGVVRRVYLPQTMFPGKFDTEQVVLALNYVVLDWQAAGTGGTYKYAFLNQGDVSHFKKVVTNPFGAVCQDCISRLPTTVNHNAPFFQPIRTRIGNRDYWLVNDRFNGMKGGTVVTGATLEIHDTDPAGTGARPLAVWVFGSKEGPQAAWDFQRGPWPLKGRFYMIADYKTDPQADSRVTALTLAPWEPKLSDILAGMTSAEVLPRHYLRDAARTNADLEAYLNEALIDWKARGFPDFLRTSSGPALRDMAVKLEKAILKLDLKAKELKDAADEDARQVTPPGQAEAPKKAPAGALKTAHLLEQRKTILMVLLGPIKQAAAQKGG
ncbi:MAG: hypothetical protein AB1491_11065 [Thermodesulfobacteriota bacterium]